MTVSPEAACPNTLPPVLWANAGLLAISAVALTASACLTAIASVFLLNMISS
ncbi:hypothetical protein GCM10011487_49750 [Steroidobacter agaridevorans]|uniref:Uncharacterized protein n=1 Tax=Steroidobacter agaridevorans TaxID=2695856 RepID=A0A829YHT9_9GAMM|nr:hypothetical protein GCM10011487_49750 [Steroidobacter agaridevorans]GFE86056.1 hypothetical protein GCM10011488_10100 [Steroidobacter agaridevorans]